MAGRKVSVKMLALVCSIHLLFLVTAVQGQVSEEPVTRHPSYQFQRLVQIVREETMQEIDILQKTRTMLLHVSRLITKPQKELEGDGNIGAKMDACQRIEYYTTLEEVAAIFEAFTKTLNPWSTVSTLNETLGQLKCFAQVQTKLKQVKPSKDGNVSPEVSSASPPRLAVSNYLQVLGDRLNTSIVRLSLLNYTFNDLPSSPDRLSPMGHEVKAGTRQAVEVETAEVLAAITQTKDMKNLLNNLKYMLGNTTQSTNSSVLPPTHYGPYCRGITVKGSVYSIMQSMFTEVSKAAFKLKNAIGSTQVKEARKELECQLEVISKFVTVDSRQLNNDEAVRILHNIDSTLRNIHHMQNRLKRRPAKLRKRFVKNIRTKEIKFNETLKNRMIKRSVPTQYITKTKVNIFKEIELRPRCCY